MPLRHGLTLYTDYDRMIEHLSKINKFSMSLKTYDIYKHKSIKNLFAVERAFGVHEKSQRFARALLPQLDFEYMESFTQTEPPQPGSHLRVVK